MKILSSITLTTIFQSFLFNYCAGVCDVYLTNGLEIICVTDSNKRISHYEKIYKKLITKCEDYDPKPIKKPESRRNYFYSIDCTFGPRAFEIIASASVQSFSTGHENPNTVLQNDVFIGICDVVTMDLRSANIERIEPHAFNCIKVIKYFDLSQNRIDALPTDIFKDMTELKLLNLSYNHIQSLTKGVFDHMPKLYGMDLTSNSASHWPDGLFHRLKSLVEFSLDNNDLAMPGHYPFANLSALWILFLSNVKLKTLENIFWQNYWLQYLYVTDNEIKSISEHVFRETRSMIEIHLSRNQLEEITPEMFRELRYLMYLNLSFNSITKLKDQPFLSNNDLRELDLRGNKITEIKNDDFRGLLVLHTLFLDSNSITNMAIDSFKNMPGLRNLSLASNFLFSLRMMASYQSIFSNTAITKLILSNNRLQNLSNIFHDTLITYLDLSRNRDLILDDNTLAGLAHLTTLHLEECNITATTDGVFANTPNLKDIYLAYNRIRAINPETFASLNINVLDLSRNKIEVLRDSSFAKVKKLHFLNISHNNVSQIGNETFRRAMLYQLDVNSNALRTFTSLAPDLLALNISHNFGSTLAGIFKVTKSLRFLDVSYNNLSDPRIEEWRMILQLNLFVADGNSITEVYISEVKTGIHVIQLKRNKVSKIHLPENVERRDNESYVVNPGIKPLILSYKTVQLFLADNPIQCDCSAYKLYKYLRDYNGTRDYVAFEDDLVCHQPLRLLGKKLNELEPTDLVCSYRDDCSYFPCTPPADDCIEKCLCLYQPHGELRTVNCSNRDFDNLPRQVPKKTSFLDLNHNNISSLEELKNSLWENLKEIHVESNAIDSDIFDIPDGVTFLGLKDNKLRNFPTSIKIHAEKVKDFKVTLSKNLFRCDCSAVPLKEFILAHQNQVMDIEEIACAFSNNSMINMSKLSYSDLCPSEMETVMSTIMYSISAAIFIVLVSSSVFYYKYKLFILSFLYTHFNCCYRLFCCNRQIDKDKIFDGFISYSSEDGEIALKIIQELEQKPPHYQFCIHERNWMPGSLITNNIVFSVRNSRKTLFVLSENFLASHWFYLEFEAAFNQTIQDKQDRLILILKGKVPDASQLPDNVRYVLKTKTYLEWGERWFFEKLRYAMHVQKPFVYQHGRWGISKFLSCFQNDHDPPQLNIELTS